METENKLIVRRLVAGILLLVLAVWSTILNIRWMVEVFSLQRDDEKYGINPDSLWTPVSISWLILILCIVIGIIYIYFSNKRPIKWIEWTIVASAIIGMVVFLIFESPSNYGGYLFITLVAIGAPTKKGFKGMPFVTQEETAQPIQKSEKVIKTEGGSSLQQLVELKKLLDSGVITKKDFDEKKKQILGL